MYWPNTPSKLISFLKHYYLHVCKPIHFYDPHLKTLWKWQLLHRAVDLKKLYKQSTKNDRLLLEYAWKNFSLFCLLILSLDFVKPLSLWEAQTFSGAQFFCCQSPCFRRGGSDAVKLKTLLPFSGVAYPDPRWLDSCQSPLLVAPASQLVGQVMG